MGTPESALTAEVVAEANRETLVALVWAQAETIGQLQVRVAELEAALGRDSKVSSKPPSTDTLSQRKKQVEARGRKAQGKRRAGKQPGAPGRHLAQVAEPDEVVEYLPARCRGCGAGLGQAAAVAVVVRQVFDVADPTVVVVEHRAVKLACGCGCETTGEFPPEATAPASYGPRIRAYGIYLMVRQHVPRERAAEALADLFGVEVATGTLDRWLTETAEALVDFVVRVRFLLGAAEVTHLDETGCRVNETLSWFHVMSTTLLTYLWCDRRRGRAGIDAGGVLADFAGTAVHDRWKPYFDYRCTHALCGAHLIRNLASVAAIEGQHLWAEEMIGLLVEIKNVCDDTIGAGDTKLSRYRRNKFRKRWDALVDQGHTANPDPPDGAKRTALQRESYNLARALKNRRDQFLVFMDDFAVPFDNNQAERDLRMIKLQQKISGEFRSLHGAQRFATIRSYISTTRKHNLNILDALTRLNTTGPWLPTIAT